MAIKVGIIGCGLIGKKRAAELKKDPDTKLIYVVDPLENAREALAKEHACTPLSNWIDIVHSSEIDVVLISTPNFLLKEIAVASLLAGKHTLVEKPLGRNKEEALAIVQAQKVSGKILKTGFNHRFHPAIYTAKSLIDEGKIGKLLSIRARYGHGGRSGMEQEWRSSKELCGGGELLDQGVHLIDLIQWFGGRITEVYGMLDTQFWPVAVEDNAYVVAKTEQGVHAMFHASWTNWKNIFSFEVYGTDGYLHVQGLGGSYGEETLEIGIKTADGVRPDVQILQFPGEDISWQQEWLEFKNAILQGREPLGNGEDGFHANRVIADIYECRQK